MVPLANPAWPAKLTAAPAKPPRRFKVVPIEGSGACNTVGMFERPVKYITVKPEVMRRRKNGEVKKTAIGGEQYQTKFGLDDIKIPVDQKDRSTRKR